MTAEVEEKDQQAPKPTTTTDEVQITEELVDQIATEKPQAETNPGGEAQDGNDDDDDEINAQTISDQIKLANIPWYPNELVWQLNTFRHELKRNKAYEKLHKFIQQANDAGLITRQELVSMLPPLLLDVQSSDIIFDMCAAPGRHLLLLVC